MTGEKIGRWGPVSAQLGRTEGVPCTGTLGLCDDWDVDAWLYAAKWWHNVATQMRGRVVDQWGPDASLWPATVGYAEIAHAQAGKILNGDGVGWLDGSRVDAYVKSQRLDKEALELWIQALEKELQTTIDVGELGYDPADDPGNRPPVTKLPELPSLPSLFSGLTTLIGVGLAAYVAVNLLRRR